MRCHHMGVSKDLAQLFSLLSCGSTTTSAHKFVSAPAVMHSSSQALGMLGHQVALCQVSGKTLLLYLMLDSLAVHVIAACNHID